MAKCEITGKKRAFGNKVTFSHHKLRRSWAPNVRKMRVLVDGKVKRMYVSTKALKSGLVERPSFIKTENTQEQ